MMNVINDQREVLINLTTEVETAEGRLEKLIRIMEEVEMKRKEVEKTRLEEQEEILIGTSGEGEHQGNQVQRKRESPSRQQCCVRQATAHNTNAEKVAITET